MSTKIVKLLYRKGYKNISKKKHVEISKKIFNYGGLYCIIVSILDIFIGNNTIVLILLYFVFPAIGLA